jgi:aminocarboxymuconate-semialdehyde decarboxylase
VNTQTSPSELLRRITIDSIIHDRETLKFVVERFGAEQIALGTDYPFPLGELEPGRLIESTASFTPEQKERMLSGTALAWLGVERERYETEASRRHSESLYYDMWSEDSSS